MKKKSLSLLKMLAENPCFVRKYLTTIPLFAKPNFEAIVIVSFSVKYTKAGIRFKNFQKKNIKWNNSSNSSSARTTY